MRCFAALATSFGRELMVLGKAALLVGNTLAPFGPAFGRRLLSLENLPSPRGTLCPLCGQLRTPVHGPWKSCASHPARSLRLCARFPAASLHPSRQSRDSTSWSPSLISIVAHNASRLREICRWPFDGP